MEPLPRLSIAPRSLTKRCALDCDASSSPLDRSSSRRPVQCDRRPSRELSPLDVEPLGLGSPSDKTETRRCSAGTFKLVSDNESELRVSESESELRVAAAPLALLALLSFTRERRPFL